MKRLLFFLLAFCISLQGAFLEAQTLLDGFSATNIGGGWDLPVGTTFTKTGDQLYVWEKAGKVYVNRWNSTTNTYDKQTTPVIDISPEVGNWRDMGMLGFALDPYFEENGYIYLMYCVDRHHLINFGTPAYSETVDDYLSATIGRITRYTTFINDIGQRVADLSTRKILLGESKSTGVPILYESHGVGSLSFAMDGTLLASTGDGSSYVNADIGSDPDTYYKQALLDSIITPIENVGVFRSQLLNSHSGKLLRIDPATGDGIPSNPFYDPTAPRSAKSRVWALGFRNPFRFSIRPNSGSVDRNIGDVGEIFIGDVGFNSFEEVTIIKSPGTNCGWPFYEGLIFDDDFGAINLENKEEPNPLYGNGGCTQPYFTFGQLFRQANPQNSNIVYNPCNPSLPITSSNNNRFLHRPPLLDWQHGFEIARVGIFSGGIFTAAVIGTPESKVIGTPFRGNASIGGLWYTGNMFPSSYKNTLFISDYGANWMKNIKVENFEKAKRVDNFAFDFNGIVHMSENPLDGSIFCVDIGAQKVKRIAFVSNKPPIATIAVDKNYGPSPLTVNFSGSTSIDPEGMPLTYAWDFGDGSALSGLPDPQHVFTTVGPLPQKFVVKLTVADNEKAISTDSIIISLNNTPPKVNIVSPIRNWFYSIGPDTTLVLRAEVSDSEQTSDHLFYRWQTILRHNNHEHPGPIDTNKVTSTVVSRIGCNGEPFHWIIKLSVTDEQGLTTYDSLKLFPACATTTPVIILQPSSVHSCDGSTVSLQTATNDYYIMPLQWQLSRDQGNTWSTIAGATSPILSLKTALADSGLRYRAVWYNNKGYTYSDVAVLNVDPIPLPPTGPDTLKFCFAASVSDLVVSGTSVKWYMQPSGGMALPANGLLTDGNTYYASQTVNGCESKNRLPIHPRVNDALHPLIVLNGSNSTGVPASYQWSLISGPNVPLIDSPGAAITTVRNLMAGSYHFRLSLDGASTSDVTVQVNVADTVLKADAGFDRTIILPDSTVFLDGLTSTGDIVSYKWKKINSAVQTVFTSSDSVTTYVIGLSAGAHSFELAVTDRKGMIKKDTVQITVLPISTEGLQPILIGKDTASSIDGTAEFRLSALPTSTLLVLSLAQFNPAYSVFQPQQERQPDLQNVYNDGTPIELGMKFRTAEDGYVSGVRFFKALGNTGTHIGELYTVDGIRLAQATFINETTSGWQSVYFDKAVRIQKNTTYVVAYYSAGGNYSAVPDFFNNSVVEPPLTALASGIDGTNGLYSYTDKPGFPSNSYFKTNYWVDVIFNSSEPAISSEPALNWVKRSALLGKAGAGNAAIYTALFTRGDNVTVSAAWGKGPLSGTMHAITQFDPLLNGNVSDSGVLSTAIVPLTVKRSNSLLIGVASDKKAVVGEGRTYSDSTRESNYHFIPAQYSAYHFNRQASSVKTYTPGLLSPEGMAAGVAVMEVMGNLRLPVVADAGQNQRLSLSIPPQGNLVQTFCDTSSVKDLKVAGNGIQWYLNETGGAALSPAVLLKDSTYYYATQLVNGCSSVQRFRMMASVKPSPPPPPVNIKDNCDSTLTFSVIPGGEIRWNTGDTSSSILVRTSDTFHVSRTLNGCTGTPAMVVGKPVLLRFLANVKQPECIGDSGQVTLIPMGGAGGYVFNSTPAGLVPAGTYLYTVTDSNNCSRQLEVVIQLDRSFWTGAVDNDWHNPGNWSKGVVPNAKTHVVIPLTALQCIVSSEDAEVASIQTVRGGTVRVDNGRKIIVSGKCLVLPPVR